MRGWECIALLFAVAATVGVNLLLGGYQADFPINHSHQIPVVLCYWDSEPFRDDIFVSAVRSAPHAYWWLVSVVLTPDTLDSGLFAIHVAMQALTYLAIALIAAGWSRRPLVAALLVLMLMPTRIEPLMGGAIFNWMYPTHTQAARAFGLIGFALWQRCWWGTGSVAIALGVIFHPFVGVFSLGFAVLFQAREIWRAGWKTVKLAAGPIGFALVIVGAWSLVRLGMEVPADWADWAIEHYAIHFSIGTFDVVLTATLCAAAAALALRGWRRGPGWRAERQSAFIALTVLGVCVASVFVGWIGLRSPVRNLIINLQPYRVFGTAVPLLLAVCAAAAASISGSAWRRGIPVAALAWLAMFVLFAPGSAGSADAVVSLSIATIALVWSALASANAARWIAPVGRAAILTAVGAPAIMLVAILAELLGADLLLPPLLCALLTAPPIAALVVLRSSPSSLPPARTLAAGAVAGCVLLAAISGVAANIRAQSFTPLVTRYQNPALRDAGNWIQANTPKDTTIAAPAIPLFRGIRCAAWRHTVYAEIEEAVVFYFPTMLDPWRGMHRDFGPPATETPAKLADWVMRVTEFDITVLLPSGVIPPPQAPLERAYDNGAITIWRRTVTSSAPSAQ